MGIMLMAGLVCVCGRFSGGLVVNAFCRAMMCSPFVTRFIMSVICVAGAGPVAALKCVSRCRRSRLIRGRQPVIIVFLFFGVCLIVLIMRFSVGCFTAQVL